MLRAFIALRASMLFMLDLLRYADMLMGYYAIRYKVFDARQSALRRLIC